MIRLNDHVWLPISCGENKEIVVIGAKVENLDSSNLYLVDDDGDKHRLDLNIKLKLMNATSVQHVQDMIKLGDLNEPGILRNLFQRYKENLIYTYTGSILVAINPYQILPIYNAEYIHRYTNSRMGKLEPHIFAIGDSAYGNMMRNGENQCIVISGESGAGKTESTKLVLQFLAASSGKHSWIEQQILEANPLMEAFGNAKTLKNDNSSRFGKYIDIKFNASGSIEGAKIDHYLLEKSRLICPMKNERNYHIFYCFLAGLKKETLNKFKLEEANSYKILTGGDCIDCDGRSDASEFATIISAMKVLQFDDEEINIIWTIIAALLHCGNISFKASSHQNTDDSSKIVNKTPLMNASDQLGLLSKDFEFALLNKSIITHHDTVVTKLVQFKCVNVRDAFIKGIYGRLFSWIVQKINVTVDVKFHKKFTSIGLLDIFGFENFTHNSFEQLCINYANESLQQFFIHHMFKMEQQEYVSEGIEWEHIQFCDNQPTLNLLACKPMNIIALIAEESNFPRGTDLTMLNKLHCTHSNNSLYLKMKSDNIPIFGINHFAGPVYYEVDGFLEKNRDTFSGDLLRLIFKSKLPLLKILFNKEFESDLHSQKRAPNLGTQFQTSLDTLMKTLKKRHPFFIRCIKPNEFKKPKEFERMLCLKQLRYSGMMETIKIRKAGYPIRHFYIDFINRYKCFLTSSDFELFHKNDSKNWKELSKSICNYIDLDKDQTDSFQYGISKIFLKEYFDVNLENVRDAVISKKMECIKRVIMAWKTRQKFLRMKDSILLLSKIIKTKIYKTEYCNKLKGIQRLQSIIKAKEPEKLFINLHDNIIGFQIYCKSFLAQSIYIKRQESLITLQTIIRNKINVYNFKRRIEESDKRGKLKLLRIDDESKLKKEMKSKNAKQEAERLYQLRLTELFNVESEKRAIEDKATEQQKKLMMNAEITRRAPVDEERIVDEMFGFIDRKASNESNSKMDKTAGAFQDLLEKSKPKVSKVSKEMEIIPSDTLTVDSIKQFEYAKYAATYFRKDETFTYSCHVLEEPLLKLDNNGDIVASLAVWVTILRFMGDLPEPLNSPNAKNFKTPVMSKIYSTLSRKVNEDEIYKAQNAASMLQQDIENSKNKCDENTQKPISRKKLVSLTLRRKSKLTNNIMDSINTNLDINESGHFFVENRPTSNLEKLHFIIGNGILRPGLRDEIYCQICKQLTDNLSRSSHARGWILLSLCVGCFAPSQQFLPYLRCFISKGPLGYAPYCEHRLRRTCSNGARNQPPAYLELEATKSKRPIILPITFMDGVTHTVLTDSATTSAELCQHLSETLSLKDIFGFSIYISLYDKVSSLGSGLDHVMDAISHCEQYAKEQGASERNAPWRLFFRKEIFTPWHDPRLDSIATKLIYQQLVRGIRYGEYRCDKDKELAMIAAQQYYIETGGAPTLDTTKLADLLTNYLPDNCLKKGGIGYWIQGICIAYDKLSHNKPTSIALKQDLVAYSKCRWPLLFSRFYDAYKFSGPSLPRNDIVIAVNWTGLYVVDEFEQVLLELNFPEITAVSLSRSGKLNGQSFSLSTVKGDDYTFTSANSSDIHDLLLFFLNGLKSRSRFVVSLQNFDNKGDDNFISYFKGDLLKLVNDTGEAILTQKDSYLFGECIRTGNTGNFTTDTVYVLPTLDKLPNDVLNMFVKHTNNMEKCKTSSKPVVDVEVKYEHTLEKFSVDNMRQNEKRTIYRTLNRRKKSSEIWKHSRDSINNPFLMKLQDQNELSKISCLMFSAILKYMGDVVSKKTESFILTDQIFQSPLINDALKDELYCQIMKQLTENRYTKSIEKGWEIMWLATGLFAPNGILLRELTSFLKSRQNVLAKECFTRLEKTLRNGQRKYPPHTIEIQAIQRRTTRITHKVYFPNLTDERFEVDSGSRAINLCQDICHKLKLQNYNGFSLFVKIADKVISVPNDDFFFDFVRHLDDWIRKSKPLNGANSIFYVYQVFFMKKIWSQTVPGHDVNADLIFHYHQELPKYLKGYHDINLVQGANLGAHIYRAKCGNSTDTSQINNVLSEIIPKNLLRAQSLEKWFKDVSKLYLQNNSHGCEDAKHCFLRILYDLPTFGSSFFEVKQTTDPSIDTNIIIAINKKGVFLINAETKKIQINYDFNKISNWSSGNTYFHMTIGNIIKGTKLLCETNLGYKIDDLLTSYISDMLGKSKN